MTTYGAYDAGLPCKNANCKSHGRPHPNCKCYGNMAGGGDVEPYCSKDRAHESGCEYFADGGELVPIMAEDPAHHVAGHIAHHGILGMLRHDLKPDIIRYNKSILHGHKAIDSGFDTIIKNGKHHPKENRSKHREHIDKWVSNGGINRGIQTEKFGEMPLPLTSDGQHNGLPGGVLNNNPIESIHPDQNIILNTAKGRVSNYLGGLRPQKMAPKLAFDSNPDQGVEKKKYDAALQIADHPMSVLHHVSDGTLSPDHIQHLNAMYPELYESMKKKVTEKIIDSQMSGHTPNYKVRQSLSLLLGVPLSSSMLPQNIMAAQAVFSVKKPQQQPQPEKSKTTAKSLSKSDASFLTSDQALDKRHQRST